MSNEKEKAYYETVAKWAEKTQELIGYQKKNMKWFLAPEIVQWFTPSYESTIARLEKELESIEKRMDRLEVEAGLAEA
ncbi:MAG: hypothetical protein PHF33_08170 [Candidatus Delongbacteria bacterium]|jgi:hypothetical protein|nr:hypothetical protein [Candidatus Delongbacteria bacterium]MDD4206170.1 hypothetical protein [Candidatus Delongbacteria bacterium]